MHTPGPWRPRDYASKEGAIWIDCAARDERGRSVAGTIGAAYATGTGSSDPAVQQANARLIAAAPELLAALEGALRFMETVERGMPADQHMPEAHAARAAIAKAKGEPS